VIPPVPSGCGPGADLGALGGAAADLTASLPAVLAGVPPTAVGLVTEVGEPSPTQAPAGGFEAWEVSPGLLGFIPVFLIAVACVFLFLSLTRHMRRVTVRQAQRDAEDARAAEDAARADDGGGRADDGGAPGTAPPADGDGPLGSR
jgi:hypothetical protein